MVTPRCRPVLPQGRTKRSKLPAWIAVAGPPGFMLQGWLQTLRALPQIGTLMGCRTEAGWYSAKGALSTRGHMELVVFSPIQ